MYARLVSKEDQGRRGALKMLAVVGGAVTAGVVGGPGVLLAVAPGATGAASGQRWVKTVPLATLSEGVPKRVVIVADRQDGWVHEKDVELGAVWLVLRGDKVECLSAVCPHLGCSIGHTEEGFFCPCHSSRFDDTGKRLGPPSPRDMDSLETKVEGEHVLVDFRRYRQGTSDRVELG